jgi:hypothetical protein
MAVNFVSGVGRSNHRKAPLSRIWALPHVENETVSVLKKGLESG